jgi:hypothetical protein
VVRLSRAWLLFPQLTVVFFRIEAGVTESEGQRSLYTSGLVLAPWRDFVYLQWFMNDEHPSVPQASLDERFANDPVMRERMHQIADLRDELIGQGCSLDEVEERVVQQIRLLGQELLGAVAQTKANQISRKARSEHPQAIRDVKKK